MALHCIVSARALPGGILRVRFATGEERVFDTRPYQTSAFFRRLGDPAYFVQVRVTHGTVTWPGGHDFDPGTIYALGTAADEAPAGKA